ncbi:MAG: hypothetical protein QM791_03995 [Ferruginibacter sp.]
MSNETFIDFDVDKDSNNQLFDNIAGYFEKYKQYDSLTTISNISSLMEIERVLLDAEDSESNNVSRNIKMIKQFLTEFLECLKNLDPEAPIIVNGQITDPQFSITYRKLSETLFAIKNLVASRLHLSYGSFAGYIDKYIDSIKINQTGIRAAIDQGFPKLASVQILHESLKPTPTPFKKPLLMISPGEMVWLLHIWIDTVNPVVANKFIYDIVSTIQYIDDDTEIKIVTAGIGSYFQSMFIKFKNYLAQKRTKDVLEKAGKAAEAYAFGRHIAPVEKQQAETEKVKAEVKNMMPPDIAQQKYELDLIEQRERIRTAQLKNLETALAIDDKLTDRLKRGLTDPNDSYRIHINNILFADHKKGGTIKIIEIPLKGKDPDEKGVTETTGDDVS